MIDVCALGGPIENLQKKKNNNSNNFPSNKNATLLQGRLEK